mgnify:CR=1 FL=1
MYNILVCDDDREIVDAIEIYLTQEGYHVLKAYDGMQAIQMLEREEIQLLIIDVMMPKLDGIRATLKIKGKEQYSDHYSVRKIRGCGQNSGTEHRRG